MKTVDHFCEYLFALKSIIMKIVFQLLFVIQFLSIQQSSGQQIENNKDWWKAGVAKAVITPRENMWMSGYAARDKPAQGTIHDLWAKALALEDSSGNRALVVTADIIGYSREMSVTICSELMLKFDLKRESIVLSSSHTHSGPVINSNLYGIYPEFDEHQKRQIEENLQFVITQIIDVSLRAFDNLSEVSLSSGVGIARFAVNRRENRWDEEGIYDAEVKGPSDHVVQVLKVSDKQGNPVVALFGYSCHATCLSLHKWSGDYPGFAQIALERDNPGLTAMFFTGFGGDQNPMPRGGISNAEQYGKELAVAVEKVLKESAKSLASNFTAKYQEIELAINPPPENAQLDSAIKNGAEWHKRWAINIKTKKANGERMTTVYPYYPIQSWQLGEQSLVILGGEVVVDYAFRLRKILGNGLMLMGYANDVMAYIPSERILEEGGYEGETSMYVYGHDGTWATGIESKIINVAVEQVNALRNAAEIK